MVALRLVALRLSWLAAVFFLLPSRAGAVERLCDPAFENCKNQLISLIRAETQGIDVAFWFMEDSKYATEIIARWNAGVPVRVLVDTEANSSYPLNKTSLQMLKDAGIPMREKKSGGILHWKLMLFVGQNTVEFSGANYSAEAFQFGTPYSDYVDEVIYFTDHTPYVNSFKTRYDDAWTDVTLFVNYANVTPPLTRKYATVLIDPDLNFVPWDNYRTRAVNAYKAETGSIDVSMYRITDRAHSDQMIAAVARGVPVRLITEQEQYRDSTRLWDAWNVDRMYMAGISVKFRGHNGLSHEKLVLLSAQGMAIFGSSNWTSASASDQHEHNLFTSDTAIYNYMRNHFDRKWNNTGPSPESKAFVPLPPGTPSTPTPGSGATGQSTSVTLQWYAGPWAHKYDIYLGTSSSSMTKILSDRELGPSQSGSDYKKWTVSGLVSGKTYYWQVVSRTMANLTATGPTWSFTTGSGGGGSSTGPLPTGWTSSDIGGVGAAGSAGYSSGTFTLSGSGADIWGTADEFRYAYKTMIGDGTIIARVASVSATNVWTKSGVMMRETLSAGSKHASMFVSSGKGLAFQRRTATGGVSTSTAGALATAPYWVRLVRTGNTFTASVSTNGSTWTTVGSETISMTSTIYVGLPLTSHHDGSLATASITNVTAP